MARFFALSSSIFRLDSRRRSPSTTQTQHPPKNPQSPSRTWAAGPVYGHLMIENAWGPDMLESQDIFILDAGNDVIMDWNMTWKCPGSAPVELGKTKEGSFAIRVANPLTSPDPGGKNAKGRGNGKMIDSLGDQDEEPIRPEKRPAYKNPAAWTDNYGTIDGKPLGICFMNHP